MAETYHVFLTRFNLKTGGRESSLRNSDNWLENRFFLFEEYCLPSVKAQTRKDFIWLIYFDHETPDFFKLKVAEYQKNFPCLVVKWVAKNTKNSVIKDIESLIPESIDFVLTTRLDNDDSIHEHFVEQLRVESDKFSDIGKDQVFNFSHGLILADQKAYLYRDICNPFSSLLSNRLNINTIWGAQHQNIQSLANVTQIKGEPMWLQLVHGKNVRNRIKGIRLAGVNLAGFNIRRGKELNANKYVVIFENLTLGVCRWFFETSLFYIKSLSKKR